MDSHSSPVPKGILFVLHIGVAWQHLPQERDFGSGMSCWRRLVAWTEAAVWPRLQRAASI
ncbi:transposase [Streptomyces sp. NPDC054794]